MVNVKIYDSNKKVSVNKSFDLFDIWTFIKGRKRMALTVVGTILGYFISNNKEIAVLSGMIVEGIYAIANYYFSEVKSG